MMFASHQYQIADADIGSACAVALMCEMQDFLWTHGMSQWNVHGAARWRGLQLMAIVGQQLLILLLLLLMKCRRDRLWRTEQRRADITARPLLSSLKELFCTAPATGLHRWGSPVYRMQTPALWVQSRIRTYPAPHCSHWDCNIQTPSEMHPTWTIPVGNQY